LFIPVSTPFLIIYFGNQFLEIKKQFSHSSKFIYKGKGEQTTSYSVEKRTSNAPTFTTILDIRVDLPIEVDLPIGIGLPSN
jgi:hypothetical protein